MTDLFLLPGAGGSAAFWGPLRARLPQGPDAHAFGWPGLGAEPPDSSVNGLDDLVAMVVGRMTGPVDLIAQSMGGLVAVKAALARPDRVRRLVLIATSAGVALDDLGVADWRPDYYRTFPAAAAWIGSLEIDLTAALPGLTQPTLLLWGDADPISPPAVGRRLSDLLPDARLRIVAGGDHDLAQTHVADIAPLIADHLR